MSFFYPNEIIFGRFRIIAADHCDIKYIVRCIFCEKTWKISEYVLYFSQKNEIMAKETFCPHCQSIVLEKIPPDEKMDLQNSKKTEIKPESKSIDEAKKIPLKRFQKLEFD